MTDNELLNTLALLRIEGVGDIITKKLINHLGSAEEVFKSKKQRLIGIEGIGDSLYSKPSEQRSF